MKISRRKISDEGRMKIIKYPENNVDTPDLSSSSERKDMGVIVKSSERTRLDNILMPHRNLKQELTITDKIQNPNPFPGAVSGYN